MDEIIRMKYFTPKTIISSTLLIKLLQISKSFFRFYKYILFIKSLNFYTLDTVGGPRRVRSSHPELLGGGQIHWRGLQRGRERGGRGEGSTRGEGEDWGGGGDGGDCRYIQSCWPQEKKGRIVGNHFILVFVKTNFYFCLFENWTLNWGKCSEKYKYSWKFMFLTKFYEK